MRTGFLLAISMAVIFALGSQASAAEIVGQVVDTTGRPVSGVQILVENASGQSVGRAVSDSTGEYELAGLTEGTYTLNAHGQSAVTYVGHEGVTINWGVAGNSVIATARPGVAAPASGAGTNAADPASSQMATSLTVAPAGVNCTLHPDDPNCKVCNQNNNPKKCTGSPHS